MTRIYQSLLHPITIAGIHEKACYFIWFSVIISVLIAGQWWILPIGVLVHLVCIAITKIDEYFFDIAMKSIKYPHCFAC